MIHDEFFTTTHIFGNSDMNSIWDELNIISRKNYWEQDIDNFGKHIPPPVVSAEWFDDDDLKVRREQERLCFRRLYNR